MAGESAGPNTGDITAQIEQARQAIQQFQESGKMMLAGLEEWIKAVESESGKKPETLSEEEINRMLDEVSKINVDRYGNGFSKETWQRLQDLAEKDSGEFLKVCAELLQGAQAGGVEAGYQHAQKEIAQLLDGKTAEEFLAEQQEVIDRLKADAAMEEGSIVAQIQDLPQQDRDEAEKQLRTKNLDKIEAELGEAQRKYNLIANLQQGNNVGPVLPKETDEIVGSAKKSEQESPMAYNIELPKLDPLSDAYDSEKRARRSRAEKLAMDSQGIMSANFGEDILERLKELEELEKQEAEKGRDDFESSAGGGSDDDVRKTAEEAGRSSFKTRPTRTEEQAKREYREGLSKWAREVTPGRLDPEVAKIYAEEQAKKEYDDNLAKWAEEESKNPNKNRFGDPELPPEEKERLVGKIFGALRGRKPLKRRMLRATIGLAFALTVFGANKLTAQGDGDVASATSASVTLENAGVEAPGAGDVVKILEDAGVAGDSAVSLAESLGMTSEDFYGGEIDYSQHDLLAEGTALYEGIADRESSFVTSSGMIMDMAKYNDKARHGNHFATSIVDLRDDKEALINALMENNIELPYQLAATTAAMPELLRACGVDESIITNENVAERAQAVMDAMLADGGGDLQKKLAAALNIAIRNENTDITVYQEYGLERTFYIKPFEAQNVDKSGDIQLATDVKQRDGDWQIQITVVYKDDAQDKITREVVDLSGPCGGQVDLYAESYVVRKAITDEDGREHEDIGVATFVTTEHNDGTTEQEVIYTDLNTGKPDGEQPEGEKTPEEGEGEDQETIKAKNAANLVAGMDHGVQGEGVNNFVNSTVNVVPELKDNGDGTFTYVSNDGTTATVKDGQVVSVADGAGTVGVTSGNADAVGTVTGNPLEAKTEGGKPAEVKIDENKPAEVKVEEGKTYTQADYDSAL